jgi:transposase
MKRPEDQMSTTLSTDVIIGVDTHKDVHAAVAISALGVQLSATTIPASSKGYQVLETWATSLGNIRAIGIEGTGSYGAGLTRFLREKGHILVEVNRPNRQLRYQKGKSDTVDAENAARAVLAGQASGQPKAGTSTVEMIRHLKIAGTRPSKGAVRPCRHSRQSSSALRQPCAIHSTD